MQVIGLIVMNYDFDFQVLVQACERYDINRYVMLNMLNVAK